MSIWLRTILVVLSYVAVLVWSQRYLTRYVNDPALRLAVTFTIVQAALIVLMLAVLLTRRRAAQRRVRRSHEIGALAQAAVAEHAAGMDRLRVLQSLCDQSRRDVASALRGFIASTRGSMRDRVAVLAGDLGVDTSGEHQAPTIELAAEASLFDRALIADRLRGRAVELAESEIPVALFSRDPRMAAAALDLVHSWGIGLTVRGIDQALLHADVGVRTRAWRVLPYIQPAIPDRLPVGLGDPSPEVRAAAAQAAGRLRAENVVPHLAGLVRDENPEVAVAAAFALAATAKGNEALQRHADHRVAFEAIEKAALGRIES